MYHSLAGGFFTRITDHQIWKELGALRDTSVPYKDIALKVSLKEHTVNFYNDPDRLAGHLKEISPPDSDVIDEPADFVKKFYLLNYMPLSQPKEFLTIVDIIKMMKQFGSFMKVLKKCSKVTYRRFRSQIQTSRASEGDPFLHV